VGEKAVIAFAQTQRCDVVGLDDSQARTLTTQLGLEVIGTLGILMLAKRRGLIPGVRPLLDAVVDQGFRLDQDLYRDVLKLAGELD
jgi:predicted nucleic acid-binding protein